jgi:hypothetical protein
MEEVNSKYHVNVNVEVPSVISLTGEKFPVIITATNTIGDVVDGEAVVTFWSPTYEKTVNRIIYVKETHNVLFVKTIEINSATIFDVDIQNELKLSRRGIINVHVKFTDRLTGKVFETQAITNPVPNSYRTSFPGASLTLIPDQSYQFRVSVQHVATGLPVNVS